MIDAVPLNVASIMSIYVGHPLEPSTPHPTSSMRVDGMNWENTLVNPKCKCDYSRASGLSQGGYTVASCGVNRSGQTRQSDYRWHAQTVETFGVAAQCVRTFSWMRKSSGSRRGVCLIIPACSVSPCV